MLTQLLQWPPKSTTVIGAGLLFGAGCYALTGSVELAIALAGLFKMLCPQDAPATDELLDALNKVPTLLRHTGPALAFALAVTATAVLLTACSGGGAQQTGVALSQDAAAAAAAVLSPADVKTMSNTCSAVYPDLVTATSPAAPAALAGTAIYPKAFCQQLLAGAVPASADKSSLTWLPKVLGVVQTGAQIAGMVLPLIAAL